MFSEKRNKWVLVDYGVAACLNEPIGFKSFTTLRGTLNYCSKEMHSIWATSSGWVDLYWNDLFGLKKTHKTLDKNKEDDLSVGVSTKAQDRAPNIVGLIANHFLMVHLKYSLYYGNQQKG